MSVPTNISIKEYNKISKCKNLEIDIRKMRHLKITTIPVIMGALGMIKKGTDKHINRIPCNRSLYEIQQIALCGTTHLLRRAR